MHIQAVYNHNKLFFGSAQCWVSLAEIESKAVRETWNNTPENDNLFCSRHIWLTIQWEIFRILTWVGHILVYPKKSRFEISASYMVGTCNLGSWNSNFWHEATWFWRQEVSFWSDLLEDHHIPWAALLNWPWLCHAFSFLQLSPSASYKYL